MPRRNQTPAKRNRSGRTIAAAIVVVAAAGALWLHGATPTSPAQTIPAQASTAPANTAQAMTAPTSQPASQPVAATVTAAATASTEASAAPPTPMAPEAPASAGQRAYLDPKTGRLREVEHDDAAAAAAAPRRLARTAGPQTLSEPAPVYGPGGAVGMAVPEDLQTFMVATRTPDGRIVMEHATGPKAASAKAAGTSTKKTSAGKEASNDR